VEKARFTIFRTQVPSAAEGVAAAIGESWERLGMLRPPEILRSGYSRCEVQVVYGMEPVGLALAVKLEELQGRMAGILERSTRIRLAGIGEDKWATSCPRRKVPMFKPKMQAAPCPVRRRSRRATIELRGA
jgi:hypothetical protein